MVTINDTQNSLVAQLLYGANQETSNSLARIASGNALLRASDNISALSIAEQLSAEVSGLRAQQQNLAMSQAMNEITNGGLEQATNILDRQAELATLAGNGALTDTQRQQLNNEFQSLTQELNRLAENTRFNGNQLLNGSGLNASLTQTDANAASALGAASNSTGFDNSSNAIQAFDENGASAAGNAAAGQLQFVDNDGVALADGDFNDVSNTVSGSIDNLAIENVSEGVSATVTAEIGGVSFSGTANDGATSVVVSDGNGTNIELALTNFDLSSAATANVAEAQLRDDFSNTRILRTSAVSGGDFSDTALEGLTGGAAGAASLRIASTNANIDNFTFVSSNGANDNTLSVEVNGETYFARGVNDSINEGDVLRFEGSNGQALQIDFTGLNNNIGNIRTNQRDQNNLVDGLNQGFEGSGGVSAGLDAGDDSIALTLGNVNSSNLFGGQQLDISTAAGASNALTSVQQALQNVTAQQAEIGAQQSRLDYAASQLDSASTNQLAAFGSLADTNFSTESTALLSALIRVQIITGLQAQTNRMGNNVLDLLNG